jgi:hypothetical protein
MEVFRDDVSYKLKPIRNVKDIKEEVSCPQLFVVLNEAREVWL